MKRLSVACILLLTQTVVIGCSKNKNTANEILFDSIPVIKAVQPIIVEASGIADSKKNKGFLWVHEDSGNPAHLYLLGHDGKVAKTISLENITNRDWEELQLSDGLLYLADIGDNQKTYNHYTIYTFTEPHFTESTVSAIKSIQFTYEDGSRDAEAFLVDAGTKDIYIITKSDNPSKIYKITYPYTYTGLNTAVSVGSLNFGGVVGAAVSVDGKEIIVKTYLQLFYFKRSDGQSILQTLQNPFKLLPYRMEPQGEAVTFELNNKGYFTLSEKGFYSTVNLYLYKRN